MSTLHSLHQQARRSKRPAFTLLELIVVLLVLGILAAIAVPTFATVKENAVTRVVQSTLETIDRNGEAIAVSDYAMSDSQIAEAVVAEMTPRAGMTITRDGAEVTVEYTNASATADGSVTFSGGIGTIVAADAGGAPAVYAIGEVGPAGGIIFITPSTVGNTTGLYFEAAPFLNPDVQRTWATDVNSNRTTAVSGADGLLIGTGAQNTIDIVAQSGNVAATSAAAYASDYTYGGFSDWFLPSKDELTELYTNRNSVGFSTDFYWSSSESAASSAWTHAFDFGAQGYGTKSNTTYVRPVRSF
jgi:prepilin-type N-terminal cleavage/methylation domain-containing protein